MKPQTRIVAAGFVFLFLLGLTSYLFKANERGDFRPRNPNYHEPVEEIE
jgi:hypothetical protein